MKKKLLLSPLIIAILIIVAGVGMAGAAILIGGGGNSENVNLSKGLVGWWKMDGDVKDSTPYGNNLTNNNTATFTTDRKAQTSKAANLVSASNQYFSIADNDSVSVNGKSFTVAGWFYADSLSTNQSWLMGKVSTWNTNAEFYLRTLGSLNGANNEVYLTVENASASVTGPVLSTGTWYFIVAWYNTAANTINIQVNNGAIASAAYSGGISATASDFRIGAGELAAPLWNGRIDDARLYKRVLTAAEITALYQEYNPGIQVSDLQKGLLGHWKFNGDAKDATPNGNNATTIGVPSATGGTITYSGGYTIHTFTTSGTFTPSGSGTVEYLVVGGGGGGGVDGGRGGGGGAGGFRTGNLSVSAQAYSVTVGAGGAKGVYDSINSANGLDSVFSTITSTGGGRGGGRAGTVGGADAGGNGGSGGGGDAYYAGAGGSGTAGQGSSGGTGGGQDQYGAGGGGGAGGTGANGSGQNGGNGGAGTSSSISGSSVCYAGGGGGGSSTGTDGSATCGGGKGGPAQSAAVAGTANTGGGGGGHAAAGGSGVVIIRYPSAGTLTTDRKGQVNKALAFNGQSDSSSASAVLNWTSTSAFSYGGWFKLNDTTTGYMLASSNGVGAGALITSLTKDIVSGKVTFIVGKQGTGQTNATSSTAYTTGSWEHYLAVYDGANNMTLYRNGVSVATGSYSNGSATSAGSGLYMMYASNNTNYVNGSIDDVRAYNRVLSATEAQALYESYDGGIQVSNLQKGLVGQWSLDGDAKDRTPYSNNGLPASGGTVTTSGGDIIHTFTSSGTFTVKNSGNIEVLVVGGGGGGGTDGGRGGGGGAGGYRYNSSFAVTAQAYSVTVGAGGAAAVSNVSNSQNGSDSVFSTITSTGGGRGGGRAGSVGGADAGGNGGSGGGGDAYYTGAGGSGNTPSTSPSQGSNGGTGSTGIYGAGGGGGASAVGGTTTTESGGNGGAGTSSSISGSSVCYAGGGGGGANPTGGTDGSATCGGGKGGNAQSAAVAGTANTGGGGGGHAAVGGSGIVVMRYNQGTLGISPVTSTTDRRSQSGKAASFNGTSEFVFLGNVGSGIKTVSFWMQANVTASKKVIDIDGTKQIELNGSSNVTATSFPAATVYVDGSSASANIPDTNWHFVTITDTTGVSASNFNIGAVSTSYFSGKLDDIRIYNRALTATEIQQLYETY